jgi:hypothetical protein
MPTPNAVQFLNPSGTSDLYALANKVYTGLVTSQARAKAYLYGSPFVWMDNIAGKQQKSSQFFMMSDLPSPEDYQAGQYLVGQSYSMQEGTVALEKPIVQHNTVPLDQKHVSAVSWASYFGKQHGPRLIREADRRLFINAFLGARAAASTVNGNVIHTGGLRLKRGGNSASSTTALATAYPRTFAGAQRLREDLRLLRLSMAQRNIDTEGLIPAMCVPELEAVLRCDNGIQVGTAANTVISGGSTLWSSEYGSGNRLHAGTPVYQVEGFALTGFPVQTTGVNGGVWPWGNQTAINGETPSKYVVNFSPTSSNGQPVFLAFPKTNDGGYPLGCVVVDGINTKVEMDESRTMTDFFRSHMFMGCDYMHPYALATIEITSEADGTVS